MKKLILASIMVLAGAGASLADPVYGTWKTDWDAGRYAHVTMSSCGAKICAVITRGFDKELGEVSKEENPYYGRKIVWDMQPEGGGTYVAGKIWQPSTDRVYKSKMVLSGNQLKVSGCFGPICKKQTWHRIK